MKKIIPLLIANILFAISLKAQIITTISGNGAAGFSGDGGAATASELNLPSGAASDSHGNIYLAVRSNARVRKVNTSGIISTIAGGGSSLGDGGQATAAQLISPYDVVLDASGNIYIADGSGARIRKVNTSGIITTVAGNGHAGYSGDGAAATAAELNNPIGVAVDASGNIYVAEQSNNLIRKINTSGIISTFAGNGTASYSGDGGQATVAEINHPYSVTINGGNVYIADKMNYRIRKVNTAGIISTIAGDGISGNSGNGGQATAAELTAPTGVVADDSGKVYIIDGSLSRVRRINTSGIISLFAGNGVGSYSGDGGQATAAELDGPMKAAFDNVGNLYIADQNNNRIREIYLSLFVSISSTNVSCLGGSNGSATATASHGTTPYTYLWSPGGQTTASVSGLSAGVYTVMVTDHDDITGTATVTIAQPTTKPTLYANIDTILNASCFGMVNGSALGGATGGSPPYSYLWNPIGSTSDTATGLSAGTFTLQVTDSTGCSATVAAIITQPASLTITISRIDSLITAIATGGTAPYTYSWNPPVSTSSLVTGLSAGTYTVEVHDGNKCSDSAVFVMPSGAELYLSLGDTSVTCGNPSYFSFDVLIASDSAKRLNDCQFYFSFPLSEFGGDNIRDGSIQFTRGPNFQYDSGANDYNELIAGQIQDSIIDFNFGDYGYTSPLGTIVDTISQVLLHVSLKITNSCGTGNIAFYDYGPFTFSHYVYEDSTYSHIDSIRLSYTTCCPYQCGDSLCPPYLCNAYCCHLDSLGNCTDSCYDTCTTRPIWCYDTIWTYKYDSSYAYYNYKDVEYVSTSYSAPIPTSACPMSISGYNNPIMAGTNAKSVPANSSILTIKGTGFGSETGYVQVTDANQGTVAGLYLDNADILDWSENQIVVKMPDYSIFQDTLTPGTGPFKVTSGCGSYVFKNLQINYNIENSYYPTIHEKARPNIVMVNNLESFDLRCDSSVWNNPKALACVKKAILTWNCYTGVDWKLGADTALDTIKQDGISDIYFSNYNFVSSVTLMETQRFSMLSCMDMADSINFYAEADIEMKRNKYLPAGKSWSYDTIGIEISNDSIYFYDAILHELGHAHGLNHINDSTSLMYRYGMYTRRNNIITGGTYPGPATLLGALDMINTSAANSPASLGCGSYSILVPSLRYCVDPTLNIPYVPDNPYNLALFPNPINREDINIAYPLTKNSFIQLKIEDATGRVLMIIKNKNESAGTYGEKINLDFLACGVYFITATINGEVQTIKFIKI